MPYENCEMICRGTASEAQPLKSSLLERMPKRQQLAPRKSNMRSAGTPCGTSRRNAQRRVATKSMWPEEPDKGLGSRKRWDFGRFRANNGRFGMILG